MNDQLSPSSFELIIDNDARRYFHDTARWGKFLAITGLIFTAIFIVMGLYLAFEGPKNERYFSDEEERMAYRVGYTIGAVLFAIIYVFPCVMLLRYSTKLKKALATNNQQELNEALRSQKNLYVYMGILTIIVLALFVLGVLGGIAGDTK